MPNRVAALYDIHGNLPALEQAARRLRATSYPNAEEFAATNVLQPPPEAQILGAFAHAELT